MSQTYLKLFHQFMTKMSILQQKRI